MTTESKILPSDIEIHICQNDNRHELGFRETGLIRKRLMAEEKLSIFKDFIHSNNRRQLALKWKINFSTMYDIEKKCEAIILAYFQACCPGPKGKNFPATFNAAIKRIKELEKKCNAFEIDLQRFYTKPYLGEAHRDNRFPVSQKEYFQCLWMMGVLQGRVSATELEEEFNGKFDIEDIRILLKYAHTKPLKLRNRAIVALSFIKGIPKPTIAKFLHLALSRIAEYIELFEREGVKLLLKRTRKDIKKFEDSKYKEAVFVILHTPPSCYDINRTTWKLTDISRIMGEKGLSISRQCISKIIKKAGYRTRKAKQVLTSNDPKYLEKLKKITRILSNLKPNEKFFSIDEFGPFHIRMQGGRSLVPKGKQKTIPQWQKSKGKLIVTAALELSTNQVTHFYSKQKNTDEMIKLLDILIEKYKNEECIYFSWDAAKWHASKKLYKKVEVVNSPEYREKNNTPYVKLAPLPAIDSQILNFKSEVFYFFNGTFY